MKNVLIQIGCNDGNDHVHEMLQQENYDFVLLVDANPNCIEKAKSFYKEMPNIHFEIAAIAGENRESIMYIPLQDKMKGITSEHGSLHDWNLAKCEFTTDKCQSIPVKCKTIDDLMKIYSLTFLTWLFIDCEGEDYSIMRTLDLDKYDIRNIQYENFHMTPEQNDEISLKLQNAGYNCSSIGKFDICAVKRT